MSFIRITRGLLFGALGAILGWFIAEAVVPLLGGMLFGSLVNDPKFFVLFEDPLPGETAAPVSWGKNYTSSGIVGCWMGALLGLARGMDEGTFGKLKRAVVAGAGLGMVGGFMGIGLGMVVYGALGGDSTVDITSPPRFFQQLLARGLGWSVMGLMLGLWFSFYGASAQRVRNGVIGGWLGGLMAGLVFQLLASVPGAGFVLGGPQLRAASFGITGAAIGFFINLVAEAFKRTWVRVLVGRNEGRDHVLDKAVCVFGRDELVEVPVYLDPNLPKRQATFRLEGNRYTLHPEQGALPMTVNGQPAQAGQILQDGDAIQAGAVTLAFFDKVTVGARQAAQPAQLAVTPEAPALGTPAGPAADTGVCAFCGQVKDPATGACGCSVAAADQAAPAMPGAPPAMDPAATMAVPAPDATAYAAGPAALGADATQLAAPPVDVGGQGPRLIGVSGPYAGLVYDLPQMEIALGREAGRDIELSQDASTSRHHATLAPMNDTFVIRDAGSANGTFVNGVRVQEHVLQPGDQVQIGNNVFQFMI